MLRLDKGLSQFDLAELSGLSEGQISNIERGLSWIGELSFSLLAGALGVSQQSLFDYCGNEAFVKNGGLTRRAPRRPAKLIVNRRREVSVPLPKETR
jgi:transcriptional regulator with XRE-family HTH domain